MIPFSPQLFFSFFVRTFLITVEYPISWPLQAFVNANKVCIGKPIVFWSETLKQNVFFRYFYTFCCIWTRIIFPHIQPNLICLFSEKIPHDNAVHCKNSDIILRFVLPKITYVLTGNVYLPIVFCSKDRNICTYWVVLTGFELVLDEIFIDFVIM